jgi:DNA replication and repair protein RecF
MSSNVRIEKLILNNYRNHSFIELEFKKNIILICGKNGSGKTNILESISIFNSNAGLKKSNLKELIKNNMKGPIELFGVNLLCQFNKSRLKVGLGLRKNDSNFKKLLSFEGSKSKVDIDKFLNIFWIVPKTTFLFQNAPEDRRNFIDQMILATDRNFKKFLLLYEKYKKERMKILKSWNDSSSSWLDVVEQKLASAGIIICDARRNFIKQLNINLSEFNSTFPSLFIELSGEIDSLLRNKPAIFVEDYFIKKLKENRKKDLLTGKTNFSANKTDIIVSDRLSGIDARNHSTGEQKMIIFSIIFSFIKLLESKINLRIIFLLDDVFSFLDENHVMLVLERLDKLNVQTLLTDIRNDWVSKHPKLSSIIQQINIDDKSLKVDKI